VNTCHVCQTAHTPLCLTARRRYRWPAQPLFELMGDGVRDKLNTFHMSWAEYDRLLAEGLSDKQADHWACRLGVHPAMVWPDWVEAGLTVADDLFVNGGGWRHAWLWEQAG
jgi:hypothetical protein